ncbi:META domain-containing protein [Actinokineospora auranticolor]|uniref:Heat shock protein HslJ n=1 Tax=Actinokineospora auranticolor TaxID=155976 RepID=A0A2S6GDH6_9PSEU|nr:META domain-containing protein [Actinokineospora auranticolor]PPK63282.1 heat shock protein HslJ [Actinokineospora auranticolor]
MRSRHLTPALFALLVIAGCGAEGANTPAEQPKPVDGPRPQGAYAAESAKADNAPRPLVAGTALTLRFADGRLTANAGCNTIGGAVDLSGGTLQASDLSATEMACDVPRHEQDQWLSGLLGAKPVWKLEGDRLTLTSADAEVVLTSVKPATLEGHKWTVDTLVAGESVSSTPDVTQASLTFDGGKVAIETGCNSGSAAYTVNGNVLKFEPPLLTKMACAEGPSAVESAVVAALTDKTEFTIDESTLSLTSGGEGLHLKLAGS